MKHFLCFEFAGYSRCVFISDKDICDYFYIFRLKVQKICQVEEDLRHPVDIFLNI